MHRKNIYKIGLSVLIALAFILPSASILGASSQEEKASVNTEVDTGISLNNLGAQAAGDVYMLNMVSPELNLRHEMTGGCYPIQVNIMNEGPGNATVKAFVDIYHKTSGTEVLMYETSFEDNFDIYNNWVQIDMDCGIPNGEFDTWSWTDARAYCDDHSMKSTMYDIYKGNQDDYLQCTKSFDVHDQDAVKFEFVTWVQGDYEWDGSYLAVMPWDYLDFEVGDNTGNWYNPYDENMTNMLYWGGFMDWNDPNGVVLPGSYYFFDTSWDVYNTRFYFNYSAFVVNLGDGWWKVNYTVPVALLQAMQLNISDIMFRFSWHSDPEFQYEGAYVDCVKVISIESMEEKVFQSHSQGEFEIPVGCTLYEFPMEWCVAAGGKDNQYDIKLWLEAIDADHQSTTDWATAVDIWAFVTDWFDVEVDCLQIESSFYPGIVVDTCVGPDEGTFSYGDDAHIMATIHADGTLPVDNIPVTAAAYQKNWEELFFADFESTMTGFNMVGSAHRTQKDAWNGDYSLGFFDETENEYLPTDTFSYVEGPVLDFYDDVPVYMEFYWKGLTEYPNAYTASPTGTSNRGDYVNPCLFDNHHNTLVGNNAALIPFRLGGYQPDWLGPMQPSCRYQRSDLTFIYTFYRNSFGYFYDGNGNEMHEASFGFYFTGDGDIRNYNVQAYNQGIEWSGVYIDDVRVYKEAIAEDPVWTQTLVIPGPLEPCETETVQFEWENLPYCNYLIKVTTDPAGACGNLNDNYEQAQIHVYTDLERASDKEMETVDYTSIDNGQFGISSSDYDNYFASNAAFHQYNANQNSILALCIGDEPTPECLDISGLTAPVLMTFDAWYEIEAGWDNFYIEVAACGAENEADWFPLTFIMPDATLYGSLTGSSIAEATSDIDGWITGIAVDLAEYPALGTNIEVRLHFVADSGYVMRGIKLDDIRIPQLIMDDDLPFYDPCDNLDNWCPQAPFSFGTYWTYDALNDQWCWNAPWPDAYQDGLIWSTDITDAYMAEFCFTYNNSINLGEVSAQVSADGGLTWFEICHFTPIYRVGVGTYCYDLSPFVGKHILIRFVAQGDQDTANFWYQEHYGVPLLVNGSFCVYDLTIQGKKDSLAPKTTATMSGTMKDSGWYTTPVKVVITATDIGGAGMGEIHYILDGSEKVVAGNKAEFTVSGNGQHTIEYWGVDAVGNVETPHNTLPAFKIDSGAKPTVSITAPGPGIYFMGKKLLSSSNTIIIGGFTAEATAADADSGIYRVTFYLDGNAVADDTTAPFSAYICSKHMGAATLKVVAEDFAQNTAEAEMTLKYFKFF